MVDMRAYDAVDECDAHRRGDEDIAIVGMACVFPKADTPAQFWWNIVNGVDCISDEPTCWRADRYHPVESGACLPVYTARGGYLGDMSRFNPAKYGVMPSGVDGAEPDQFLALRVAFEALADAGVPDLPLNRAKTGVILGRGVYVNRGVLSLLMHGYGIDQLIEVLRQLEPERDESDLALIRSELRANLAPFTTEVVPGLMHCAMTGRIANRLDLSGPTYVIDAACASTLLAVEHALHELRSGRCDAVLAGGVQVSSQVFIHQLFCQIDALSQTGQIAPFSAQARGTLLGEGCGVVVLKRRSDAERDGNRIYALIKSVGVASDGRGVGLLAPRTEGQQLAIRRAYESSPVSPSSVGLIEAHGTGIPLGDRTEIGSLTACCGGRVGEMPTVALGTVKSMIGHLIPASGAASLIKTALSLFHRVVPPTLHADVPHPDLDLDRTPFYLSTSTRPWCHGDVEIPRRAAIDAFGFGGINAHVVLEEHRPMDEAALEQQEGPWPVEVVVVSAADNGSLRDRVIGLADWVGQAQGIRLLDVAASCAATAATGACRVAIVAGNLEELGKKLRHVAQLLGDGARQRIQDRSGIFWYREPLARAGRLAFTFPGEGAQYPNMLADLCRHFREVRREFDCTDTALGRVGWKPPLSRSIFPLPAEAGAAESDLFELDKAVVAVAAAERALLALVGRLGIRADAMVGHSTGEFGSLLASGAFAPVDKDALLRSISDGAANAAWLARSELVPGAVMIAVGGMDRGAVDEALSAAGGRVAVAMDNCPNQLVLVGDEGGSAALIDALRGRGGLCERLAWGRAYHTSAIAPAIGPIEEFYRSLKLGPPRVELWSCATADRFPREPEAVHQLAVQQWCGRVRFRETVEAMYAAGVRVFLEVGPRDKLSAFVSDTLGKRPHAAIPLDVAKRPGLEQLCRAVGMLVAHGVPVDLQALYRQRKPRLLDLDAAPPAPAAADPVLNQTMPELRLSQSAVNRLRRNDRNGSVVMGAKAGTNGTDAHSHVPTTPVALPGVPAPEEAPSPSLEPAATASPRARNARSRALVEFQRTMRLFLETQEHAALARFTSPRKRHSGLPQNGTLDPDLHAEAEARDALAPATPLPSEASLLSSRPAASSCLSTCPRDHGVER